MVSEVFDEAGDDSDLHDAHMLSQWTDRRSAGLAGLDQARRLLEAGDRTTAEEVARQSLKEMRSALNWAEFWPHEEQAHDELDESGRWVRSTFGCHLTREGTIYSQACPVALGHNRVGFSVGGVANRICSLCVEDLSECPHMRGRAYLVPGGSGDLGWCRVCGAAEACEHESTQLYRASVVARIHDMNLDEVSLVTRPAHPDARIETMSVSHEDLAEAIGADDFSPGVDVVCSRCLLPCEGLIRPQFPHR